MGKKILPALLLAFGSAFAQSSNLQGAINNLESTSRSVLLVITVLMLAVGLLLTPAGLFIYYKKLKGAYKAPMLWKAAAFGAAGIGIIALLAGILGLAMFLLAPTLIRGLMAPG